MVSLAMMRRDHPLAEVIIFSEVEPVGGRQFAGIPELVHHPLVRRTVPHLFLAGNLRIKGLCRQRPLCRDPRLYLFAADLRCRFFERGIARHLLAQSPELALPHRVKFHRQDRSVMGKMFEHRPVLAEHLVEHRFAIILVAAPQDMMVGAGDILDRVELDIAEAADRILQVERSGRCLRQPLCLQPEPARLPVADPQRHRDQTAVVSICATLRSRRVANMHPMTIISAPATVVSVIGSRKNSQPKIAAQMKALYSRLIRFCASARA